MLRLLSLVLGIIIVTSVLLQHAYVNASNAFIDTDKDEISLGEDLTIMLAEPDANIDSRSIDRISFDTIFISTDKFDETPLANVLSKTGIRASQSFLRETGFNTGIFEVTLESINSKMVNRGSRIEILYFDDTPSGGGSPIRIETVIPVVEAKIAITFDRNEYSPFDQIEVKLAARMFNVNRNKIDTLSATTANKVVVTASSGHTYYPPMLETGVSTGVFVGRVQLTSDQNETKGDLTVTSGDSIRVTISIAPGFEVSDSAVITATTGKIVFDRSEYSAGDTIIVTVTDRDENRSPNAIDTIKARVWSNTDIAGIELTLEETASSSGEFEGMLTLSSEKAEDSNLLVTDSDVLIASYHDRTIPSLTKTVELGNLFAKATLGSAGEVVLSVPAVLDQNGQKIGSVRVGGNATIHASITNAKASEEAFVFLVHITDSEGFTSDLSFVTGTLEQYQSISIGRNWIPDSTGAYTVTVFLWTSLEEPISLSPIKKTIISVV